MKNHFKDLSFCLATCLIFTLLGGCRKDKAPNIDAPLTVTDASGNVYQTIKIGTRIWMAENLKTTKYRGGADIPNVAASADWKILTTGAYCDNPNVVDYAKTFGHLYNWYAVETTAEHNLAPEGWHVANDTDWADLISATGGANVAGVQLKVPGTVYWLGPNTNSTNASGFTALAAGYRQSFGAFYFQNDVTSFWASSSFDATLANGYDLYANDDKIYSLNYPKTGGFSVRCVKD